MTHQLRTILAIAMLLAYSLGAVSTCMIVTWLHSGERLVWVKTVDFNRPANEFPIYRP